MKPALAALVIVFLVLLGLLFLSGIPAVLVSGLAKVDESIPTQLLIPSQSQSYINQRGVYLYSLGNLIVYRDNKGLRSIFLKGKPKVTCLPGSLSEAWVDLTGIVDNDSEMGKRSLLGFDRDSKFLLPGKTQIIISVPLSPDRNNYLWVFGCNLEV